MMTVQLAAMLHQLPAQSGAGDDIKTLSALNARFINNFVTQDTASHNEIIHKDFICINNNGSISPREEYMKSWHKGYETAGYTSFSFTDESIRLFGNMALVRSRTVYTKQKDGKTIHGGTIYTDTYVRENGRWWCVQAQITPIQ